jgi:uncharacterized protein YhfF
MTHIEYWKQFTKDYPEFKNDKYIDVFHFELTEKLANELLDLVLTGIR